MILIADAIYNLSNNPASIVLGWCYSSRQNLADLLGISKRTVQRAINELVEKELVNINQETNFLRTTQKWYDEFVRSINYSKILRVTICHRV